MKLNITSPWYPISTVLITAAILFVMWMSGVLNPNVVDQVLVLSVLFHLLIYFPILTFSIRKRKHPKRKWIILNIGLLCVALWLTGYVLKQTQIQAGQVLRVAAALFFMFNFLPSWFRLKTERATRSEKWFYFCFCTFFGFLIFTAISKIQHWGFYPIAAWICIGMFLFFLMPTAIWQLYRRRLFVSGFIEPFIFVFMLAYIVSNFQLTHLRDEYQSRDKTNQLLAEQNLSKYEDNSRFVYNALFNMPHEDQSADSTTHKAQVIKDETGVLIAFIRGVKRRIVAETDKISQAEADTINFSRIKSKVNDDVPTSLLLGHDLPDFSSGKYLAKQIRERLERYSRTIEGFLPEASRVQFKQHTKLIFYDGGEEIDGVPQIWEVTSFYHKPLGNVFTVLTNIEADVRYAEMIAINEMFNHANIHRKDNVAAQLAELSEKYEREKKEKEIAILKKDMELNVAKLRAKDLAISEKEQTIIYFVVAIVGFGFLTILIIRSNILRKRANNQLREQKLVISRQKEEVEVQKQLVEAKQHEILDSIHYAKRLQEAILPPAEFINEHLPDNFVLYQPKDVVAGDFYWAERQKGRFFIAAADSTGHGVPGAMVSVVCSNALNRAVKEFGLLQTGQVLDKTRELVLETFEKSASEVNDGMDISLLCIDETNNKVTWSGANNPLWYMENGKLKELKPDKQPVGRSDHANPFTTHAVAYQPGTVFYLFTDGLADQFGGPQGKKFKYRQFEELLTQIHLLPMKEQVSSILDKFMAWKGSLEQVDDICIIGLRV